MDLFYDQHSSICGPPLVSNHKAFSRIDVNNSPGTQQVHSSNSIFKYNNFAIDFNMSGENDFNPLKLRHGYGFDKEDEYSIGQEDNQYSIEARKINKMPFKVLDAPQLQDDFYLNLVDWSSQNVLAVGLNRSVYIWSACTS